MENWEWLEKTEIILGLLTYEVHDIFEKYIAGQDAKSRDWGVICGYWS